MRALMTSHIFHICIHRSCFIRRWCCTIMIKLTYTFLFFSFVNISYISHISSEQFRYNCTHSLWFSHPLHCRLQGACISSMRNKDYCSKTNFPVYLMSNVYRHRIYIEQMTMYHKAYFNLKRQFSKTCL